MLDLPLENKCYEVSRSLIFLHVPSHAITPVLGKRAPKFIVDYCREIIDNDLLNRFGEFLGCPNGCISEPPNKEALSNYRIVIFYERYVELFFSALGTQLAYLNRIATLNSRTNWTKMSYSGPSYTKYAFPNANT